MNKDLYFQTFNKQIAVAPPKEVVQSMKKIGGLAIIDEKLSLMELEVLFDAENAFEAGDKVYIHSGSAKNHAWFRAVYTVDGVEFILVPLDCIYLASSPR